MGGCEPRGKEQPPGSGVIAPQHLAPPLLWHQRTSLKSRLTQAPCPPSSLSRCALQSPRKGPWTHLFQLDLRVDLDIADLTVEGSVLGRGLWFPGSGRPQPRVSFDGAQSTSGLQNRLVLSTWSPQRAGGKRWKKILQAYYASNTHISNYYIGGGASSVGAFQGPWDPSRHKVGQRRVTVTRNRAGAGRELRRSGAKE